MLFGLFLGASFFIDGLSYATVVRSMRNALQLYRTGTDPSPEHIYVSDGAHNENAGVMPLLQRKCDLIVVCDTGEDSKERFDDVMRVLDLARDRLGCSFRPCNDALSFDVETQLLREFPLTDDTLHLRMQVKYADGKIGDIVILKPRDPRRLQRPNAFSNDQSYRNLHGCCCLCCHTDRWTLCDNVVGSFPHHGTANQFFSQPMFDAYLTLGRVSFREAFGLDLVRPSLALFAVIVCSALLLLTVTAQTLEEPPPSPGLAPMPTVATEPVPAGASEAAASGTSAAAGVGAATATTAATAGALGAVSLTTAVTAPALTMEPEPFVLGAGEA